MASVVTIPTRPFDPGRVVTFTFADHPGPVTLGTVPAGGLVTRVDLVVDTAFDPGVQFTIGTDVAQGLLTVVGDSSAQIEGAYGKDLDEPFVVAAAIRLFFVGPTPTVGAGRVVVLFL